MPQRSARLPLFTGLKHEVAKGLAALRQEITQREQELAALKAEAARWRDVIRGPIKEGSLAVTLPRARPSKRVRLDWSAVLQKLPPQFTIKEVAHGAGKPLGHVYVYVSRWMKDKKVRRVKDGYQKL